MPVRLTASLGQINGLVAVGVIFDALLLKRRSPAAGLDVGFATAIKLTPAIMIGWYFVGDRRRGGRTAIGAFLAATLLGVAFYPSASYKYRTAILFDTRRVGPTDSIFSSAIRRYATWLPLRARC
jgi:alpha-1,2-mannosyltransferase